MKRQIFDVIFINKSVVKKLMEWPGEGDIRRKRLLRRADDIESCINVVIGD